MSSAYSDSKSSVGYSQQVMDTVVDPISETLEKFKGGGLNATQMFALTMLEKLYEEICTVLDEISDCEISEEDLPDIDFYISTFKGLKEKLGEVCSKCEGSGWINEGKSDEHYCTQCNLSKDDKFEKLDIKDVKELPKPLSKKKLFCLEEYGRYSNTIENHVLFWEYVGIKIPLTIPTDKKLIDYLIEMCESDPHRACTQGTIAATKYLSDEEFKLFMKECYYNYNEKHNYDKETLSRIHKIYGKNIKKY